MTSAERSFVPAMRQCYDLADIDDEAAARGVSGQATRYTSRAFE
jgi:hypothetical protein